MGEPSVVTGSARFHLGYESSSEESVEEKENSLVGMNMDESIGEEPVPEQEGASVGGQSPDDENGVVLEETVGEVGTEEEEDVVVDTAAQVTLVSEEFYKSQDPAPPIRKEVVMNTAGKGMQMNLNITDPFQVVLGTHQFSVQIYVAPIEEEMLLGLNFLEANRVSLHLKRRNYR